MNRDELRRRAGLDEAALDRLEQIGSLLPLMADLAGADLFVDCMENGRMFVAAQAGPSYMPSAYRTSVLGCYAERTDEPAVYRAMETCTPVWDIKAVTQEDSVVRQDVVPITDGTGRVIGTLISERDVSRDIRREKKYEAMVRRVGMEGREMASAETVARREAHHRIKNHLQMIASMMNLQARQTDSPEVRRAFQENTARILSIAAINELLTSHMSRTVSLWDFLEKLRHNLMLLYGAKMSADLLLEGDNVQVDPDQATDLALVVNELVSNAYRHAYAGREGGTVRILLKRGEKYSSITVQDDGTGMPHCQEETGGLGLNIVKMLVRDKLGGKIYVTSNKGGTTVTVDFRMKPVMEEI